MDFTSSFDALVAVVLPIITGWLSVHVYNGIKQLSEKLMTFSPYVHAIGSAVLSFVVGFAAAKLGVPADSLPTGPLSAELVNAVLTMLAAAGIFRAQKRPVVTTSPATITTGGAQ